MKGLQRVFWFLYKCLAFYTLLVFALTYWTPSSHWLFGFVMLSFPIALALNIFSVFFWLFFKPAKAYLPIVVSLLSLVFLPRTYSFGKVKDGPDESRRHFKIMNYNVSGFSPSLPPGEISEGVSKMKRWINDQQADILCFPEYVNKGDSKLHSITDYFKMNGFVYHHSYDKKKAERYDYHGMVIFSKYPIISSRDTIFAAQNGLIQTDIRIGRDTVRIIGVHLYSMTLKLYTLVGQKEISGIKRESRNTFSRIKNGFIQRAEEWKVLRSWITSSPYPVIVCGDFNDTPYSYVYGKSREVLTNSFEEKGAGFGYTYNHLPYFIRIDHQFYDKQGLDLVDFSTENSVRFSDHYPVTGTYSFK